MSIQCFEGTSTNYPVNTYQYGLLYVTHGINNNVIQQIYIPHHNNIPYETVSIAHRMKYDDKQNFYAWIYAYETDYKQISLNQSGYIIFRNGLIIQYGFTNIPIADINVIIIFPISFTIINRVVVTPSHNGSLGTYSIVITTGGTIERVSVMSSIGISAGVFWQAIGY